MQPRILFVVLITSPQTLTTLQQPNHPATQPEQNLELAS